MTLSEVLAKYAETADFLGVDLTDPNQRGIGEDAPIHIAAFLGELGDIEALVAGGADIRLAGDLGNTALHEAASMGHYDVVKRLLELGADPWVRNELGQTPRDRAAMAGHRETVRLLDARAG